MFRPFVLLLTLLLILWIPAAVEAFSARITRPWESPATGKRNSATIRFYVTNEFDNDNDNDKNKGSEEESSSSKSSEAAETKSSSEESDHTSRLLKTDEQDGNENEEEPKEDQDDEDESLSLQEPEIPGSSSQVVASGGTVVATPTTTTTTTATDGTTSTAAATRTPTVKSCLPDLIAMTRPSNLPGVVLFHMLGIHLATTTTTTAATTAAASISFWKLVAHPSMMVTLVALLLTSSTSMLVNDYYDYKLGNDSSSANNKKSYRPLPSQKLPLRVAKRFLSYLYAAALVCAIMVPGAPARMSVVSGLMLTFWYTQHLKPKTWLKNAVCASLIALSPLTSGVAAVSLLTAHHHHGVGVGAVGFGGFGTWGSALTPLWRVVAMLFVGILGREITMDINDVPDDADHGVRTVPVVYGRKFASAVGATCSLGVALLALSVPLWQIVSVVMGGGGGGREGTLTLTRGMVRRLTLASVGSLAQLGRSWQVLRSEGQDPAIVDRAVDEGLLTVVVLLASFV
jgi:4-hydroxybenzoate polyprenyltransferase